MSSLKRKSPPASDRSTSRTKFCLEVTPTRTPFADAYRAAGGTLPTDWRGLAALLDLVNLAGLLAGVPEGSRPFDEITTTIRNSLVFI